MAIDAVERAAAEMTESHRGELPVYHAIVHNDTVVTRLEEQRNIHFIEDLNEIELLRDEARERGAQIADTVVFSAHGVSPAIRDQANQLGLHTLDATCPLVTKVHSEAKKFAKLGYHVLLIGDSTHHQEVIGTKGEAPEQTTVVSVTNNLKSDPALADASTVEVPDPNKVLVLTQTTLSVDDTNRTIAILRKRFPKLVVPSRDDLCYATKNRQDAVKTIAPKVDLFLVVTSNYSSNGMRLLELAEQLTGNAVRIEKAGDIDAELFDGIEAVGITSAASTPDDLVQAIVTQLRNENPDLEVIEDGEWEKISFRQPKPVAPTPRR